MNYNLESNIDGYIITRNEYDEIVALRIAENISTVNSSFAFSAIKSLEIPNSVSDICDNAFINCHLLKTLVLGKNLQSIGNNSFQGAGLQNLIFPNSLTSIGRGAFADADLETVQFGSRLQVIGAGAFFNNDLSEITLPNNLNSIQDEAFSGNHIEEITIPNSVVTIGDNVFAGNNLEHLIISSKFENDIKRICGKIPTHLEFY